MAYSDDQLASGLDALATSADGDLYVVADITDTNRLKKQTKAQLVTDLNASLDFQAEPAEGAFVDGDKTKLDGIETAADVTDATNVTAAGALMDSEVTNLADVKAFATTDYATAAQGATADTALQPADAVTQLDGTANRVLYVSATGDVTELALGASGTYLKSQGATSAPTFATPAGSGDFLADGTVPMTGDIDLGGNNIDNGGVIFLTEQLEADVDVAGKGQIWVDTQTPNKLYFTDDAGTDFDLTAAGTPEGTAILSTGETGATKFLREDGDGTCSWQTPAGAGNVSNTGTPADNQLAVWTDATTVEGSTGLTFNSTGNKMTLASSGSLDFGAVNILSDSSGTMTLSNIDALDATTEATIEAAIDSLANLTVVGTVVTGNVDAVVSAADLTTAGKVELATVAETNTGTDATRAVTPDGLDGWTGSAQVTTTGALNSGSITSGFGAINNGASNITTTGDISGGTVNATGDTSAADNAAIGYTAAEGLILTGQGSTDDVTIKNDADASVLTVPTGTTTVEFQGSAVFDAEVDDGNSSTADTIDWTTGNKHKSTLTGNCTYTFTEPTGACNLILKLVQDVTGSRTVTWPADVKWPAGTAPTLSTAASSVDIVSFYYDGTDFYGQSGLNFS